MFTSLINASELQQLLPLKDLVIIDCRFALSDTNSGRNDYIAGHIPNAQYAHLDQDLSGAIIAGSTGRHPFPEIEEITQKISNWGISEKTQVVAYDQGHGGIAARLWFMLKWLGHSKVAVLNGGWKNWTKNGLPVDTNIPNVSPSIFLPRPKIDRIVSVEQIEQNLEHPTQLIIDSRSEERYRGDHEPIDPIAGHIPNAISAPFAGNLDDSGLFKSKEALSKRFDQLLKGHPQDKTIFYCGSGVTACHNLLALSYIGKDQAKLYPGSWSEWITKIQRPIAITK